MTPGLHCIRTSVALTRLDHVAIVALRGTDAIEVLDRLSPKNLYLRDGDVLQTVFLRPDGTIVADVTAIADDQDFLLLVEGMGAAEVTDHLTAHVEEGEEVEVGDLSAESVLLGVDGPYAWELLARTIGPEVVGLPYLHAVALDDGAVLVRAGKTGEFGYVIVCAPDQLEGWESRLRDVGAGLDIGTATVADLDTASIENFFYCPRTPALEQLSLAQLQLQWRVSPDKDGYTGHEATAAAMARPAAERLCYTTGPTEVAADTAVVRDGADVGRVLTSVYSPTAEVWMVLCLMAEAVAHPGQRFSAGDTALLAVTPPLVNNRSLYIDPQRHTYATRLGESYPELV